MGSYIWEVRDDFIHGIQFKNTKTGNYIKGNGANCIVGSLAGYYGNSGSWTQLISGTFMNDAHDKCCCVDSANDNEITHVYCKSNTCAQFVFHVIRPSLRTRITSFDNLAVNDHVIIESASGFCGYLTESDSKLITSAFGTIWQVTNDYNVAGIEFKNTQTGNYIMGNGINCFVGSITGSGNASIWAQEISGTFDNDAWGKCCCVDSADDTTITHGSCCDSCAQFVFHVIRVHVPLPSNYIVPFNDLIVGDYVIIAGTSGGYLKDNEDGTLISSSTFDDTATWEVT
eukprot:104908_1